MVVNQLKNPGHFFVLNILICIFLASCGKESGPEPVLTATELGSNFNHNPEIIDFKYLEKAGVTWIRTTPRIFNFIMDDIDPASDPGLQKVKEAGERGYKVAFGFRWDFKSKGIRIPLTGSQEETEYFQYARAILDYVGPHIDIFKLGNEPLLETMDEDMEMDNSGVIPLVRFTGRLMDEVVTPWYLAHPDLTRPDIYTGAIHAIFEKAIQENPACAGLIALTKENPNITGIDLHLHISEIRETGKAFQFLRSHMPEKPVIVTEFSLHRLYIAQLSDKIGSTTKGREFATHYGRDPEWKLYDWYSLANSQRVSKEEWRDLFLSRSWYPKGYMQAFFTAFQNNGVVLATYPLLQQYCPATVTAQSNAWFINPIFCQNSLQYDLNGDYSANPLCYDDFVNLVNKLK